MKTLITYFSAQGHTKQLAEEFAKDIGADAYTKDAAEAVLVAKKLLGIED